MSEDTGWLNFTYAEEVDRIDGTSTWLDVNGALLDDGAEAQNNIDKFEFSHWLRVYSLDGSVPSNCIIDGIELQVHRRAEKNNRLTDSSLRLSINSTVLIGDNKASAAAWSNVNETITYGSGIDIWNSGITFPDINNSNFGIMFSVQNNNKKDTKAFIRYIGIKIYYTSGVLPGIMNISKINGIPINQIVT